MTKVTGTKVTTNQVRLSSVHALEPHVMEERQEKKYSCMLTIPKNDKETLKAIKETIKTAYEGVKGDKLKGIKFECLKTTSRDGDKETDTEERSELENAVSTNVPSKTEPQVVKREDDVFVKTDGPDGVHSGVYAITSVNLYAYSATGNKEVTAGPNNILTLCRGDFLGGHVSAEFDFGDLGQEDEEDDTLS